MVYKDLDGSVRINVPNPKQRLPGETDVDFCVRIAAIAEQRDPTLLVNLSEKEQVSDANIPVKRHFRNTWTLTPAGKVEVHMPLARTQKMAEIRMKRDKLLLVSDGKFFREQENVGPKVGQMKIYRQALRDIPQNINLDLITTPEALETFEPVWPVEP